MKIGCAKKRLAKWNAAIQKIEALALWHTRFAWLPTTVEDEIIWLEKYLRKRMHLKTTVLNGKPALDHSGYWEYKLLPEKKDAL